MNNANKIIEPIAYIRTDFKEKFGIPRQSGRVNSTIGKIVFYPKYCDVDAIRGIEGFSHLWLIFDFSKSHRDTYSPTVRPPRLGGNERIGVFASRSPYRPNSLGLSSVKLLGVEYDDSLGNVLLVSGADLLDGTPIYDIKPYLPFTDCHTNAVGGYADTFVDYSLTVNISEELLSIIAPDKQKAVIDCLAQDPRPAYQSDENRVYSMRFADFDIHFTVKDKQLTVKSVDIVKNT